MAVLTLAVLARLVPFLSLLSHQGVPWIYGRGVETGFVAHALLSHQGFSSPLGAPTGPTALISPGYVLLVTGVFRIFGEASSASAVVILLAQIALGVLSVWLTMRLAARLANGRAALVAGSFFALWPPFLWVPTIFWDTSITLCLLPALLLLSLDARERSGRSRWLALGVLCALAVLTNAALCLTAVASFCWAAWHSRPRRRDIVLAASVALFLYAPWPLRNAHALHAFVPLRTTVGLELWMGNREGATGYLDESAFPLYNRAELARYKQLGEIAYMREKSALATAAIRRHPGTFAVLTVRRFFRFWIGTGNRNGAFLYAAGATLTLLCGFAGLFTCFRHGSRSTAFLCALPLFLFPLPYYITHAEFRYRLALDPLLIALAGSWVAALSSAPQDRRQANSLQASVVTESIAHA